MLKSYEIPQCPICFEDLMENLSVTRCGHVFHKKCIEQALQRKNLCPLDREVATIDQLRTLSFAIMVDENREIKEFFDGISDEEKKSIGKLSLKLHAVLKEKQKLADKLAGFEQANDEFAKELEK